MQNTWHSCSISVFETFEYRNRILCKRWSRGNRWAPRRSEEVARSANTTYCAWACVHSENNYQAKLCVFFPNFKFCEFPPSNTNPLCQKWLDCYYTYKLCSRVSQITEWSREANYENSKVQYTSMEIFHSAVTLLSWVWSHFIQLNLIFIISLRARCVVFNSVQIGQSNNKL